MSHEKCSPPHHVAECNDYALPTNSAVISQDKFKNLAFVADLAFLNAEPGSTDATRLRKALVAVLGGLGYTVQS